MKANSKRKVEWMGRRTSTPTKRMLRESLELPTTAWLAVRQRNMTTGEVRAEDWGYCPNGNCTAEGGPVTCYEGWPAVEVPCE